MLSARVIPCLLLKDRGLVKTVQFREPTYVGDPINAVKIFNDKEVDELVFLDISATCEGRKPPVRVIAEIASECFMPLGYGGGIRSVDDAKHVLALGVEKVIINSYAVERPAFIREAADTCGGQSIVVSIDVKRTFRGRYEVYTHGGRKATGLDPADHARRMEALGAGEILVTSVDRDGTMSGFDIDLIRKVAGAVGVPVIACGGAGNVRHLAEAVKLGGASAVCAGSMFVFHGRHRAVLISYPPRQELEALLCRSEPSAAPTIAGMEQQVP
jgi:cyclase